MTRKLGLVLLATMIVPAAATRVQAQAMPTVFYACYVPLSGTVYRIRVPGVPNRCLFPSHTMFSWIDGLPGYDHGLLNGRLDDDHPQYLLVDGTRAMTGALSLGGFKITGLGAGTAAGDAVRYEQAVKTADPAGGDLDGAYPNPTVDGLQGRAVSNAAPAEGQVLTYNATTTMWEPRLPSAGSGGQAGGDLAGAYPNPTVDGLQGAPISPTAPATGDVLQFLGSSWYHVPATDANTVGSLVQRDGNGGFAAGPVRLRGGFVAVENPTGFTVPSGTGPRLLWHPSKFAFRAGYALGSEWDDANIGDFSIALGAGTTASATNATALGANTTASGNQATAIGNGTVASGIGSTAMGLLAVASGGGSTALGSQTMASGHIATAMGYRTVASGDHATAMGYQTTSGPFATAMGSDAIASGTFATAMGYFTVASGDLSTAMGSLASTNAKIGSFVYGDRSTNSLVNAAADNSFVVRAQRVWFGTSGDQVVTADRYLETSTGAYLSTGGAWTNASDVNRKEHFRDVDAGDALERLSRMPIRSWNYKAEDDSIRHLGPTAQDFYAAFRLGDSDKAIGTVDAAGVALLTIQALERRTREQATEMAALRELVAARDRDNARLEANFVALRNEVTRRLAMLDSLQARR